MGTIAQWAEQVYDKIHPVYKECLNKGIPEDWLAGLIYVECSSLNPKAKRFEAGVYKSVECVKHGGKSQSFPGFNTGAIYSFIQRTHDPELLKTLATSYGLGQIMGYHYLNKWGILPNHYTNLTFKESMQLTLYFMADNHRYVKTFKDLVHIHNTGSLSVPTYSPQYVANAEKARAAYKKVMEARYG